MTAASPLHEIEARRAKAGIPVSRLAAAANLSARVYFYHLHGERVPSAGTIGRLKAALARLTGRAATAPATEARLVLLVYLAVLGVVCQQAGVATADVHRHDPNRRATADPDWQRAAKLRRRTVYLVNTAYGVAQSEIARAIGVTPAAVSLACKAIEDEREDPATDLLFDTLTATLTGETG